MPDIFYSGIGKSVTVRVGLKDLSMADKKELFADLYKELKFSDGLSVAVVRAINKRFDSIPTKG